MAYSSVKEIVTNFVNIPENAEIALLDAMGRQLAVQHKLNSSNHFDLERLSGGVYYVAILHQGTQLEIKRFIKQP